MDIEIKAWLYDILNAIHEIEGFFIDTSKDVTTYRMISEPAGLLKEILKLLERQ